MAGRPKKNLKSSPCSQLRIIAGQWRGRVVAFTECEGLRPTGSRIRETLFNWLAPAVPGSRCLDLFAGSGALGLEALSRGAQHCTFVERDQKASDALTNNLTMLVCDRAEVVTANAINWLASPEAGSCFDLVFIDPPFNADLWQPALEALERHWLKDCAHIYMESPANHSGEPWLVPSNWHLHKHKVAGKVAYSLYIRRQPECTD